MHTKIQNPVKICSVGKFLPEQRIKSDHLFEEFDSFTQYGIPTNWMSAKMGIVERRMANANALPSDLAIPAAKDALAKLEQSQIDAINLVIFCGIERDQSEPATAHYIQDALGLHARHAFDLGNACFGFMDGMEVASHYINAGATENALIVTGEVPTKILTAFLNQLKHGVDIKYARKVIGALSVGDAGGAVVLGPNREEANTGFKLFNMSADSKHTDKCVYKKHADGHFEGQMLMGQISFEIVRQHKNLINDTLNRLGWDEFDWMLTHQMGQKPFDKLSQLPGVKPDKMIKTFDKLGNITSATFPVNFHKLVNNGKVQTGDRIGGCFAGSGLAIGQLGYQY